MTVTTYEGIVEKGKIRLKTRVRLPENARVFVIVPETQPQKTVRVASPRLVNRKQTVDFKLTVSEQNSDV